MSEREYRITVRGRLSDVFADGFDDMGQARSGGNTVLHGPYVDQSHLHGVLDRLRALGIEIVSLDTEAAESTPGGAP